MKLRKPSLLARAQRPSQNLLAYLPNKLNWFLGYRSSPPAPLPPWAALLATLVITMGAMLANLAVALHAPLFTNHWRFTVLIPSFAASCVLIYNKPAAPLSQPRNLVFGHFLSALVGVCITKLFMTNPKNEKHLWIAGALSVAVASVVMDVTNTTHPPSGATALLPSMDEAVRLLGWNYLPAVLIFASIFLGVALLANNLCNRRYPIYWISPTPPPQVVSLSITADKHQLPSGFALTEAEHGMIKHLQSKLASNGTPSLVSV